MKDYWVNNNYRGGFLGKPPRRTERYNYDVTYNSVNEKGTFTLKEAYQANESRREFYKDNNSFKGGIRRDVYKLVRDGYVSKISKGVYKINV